jgi:hypothetical protein
LSISILALILILLGFVLQFDKSRHPIHLTLSRALDERDERDECTGLDFEFLDIANVFLKATVSPGGFNKALCSLLGVKLERGTEKSGDVVVESVGHGKM